MQRQHERQQSPQNTDKIVSSRHGTRQQTCKNIRAFERLINRGKYGEPERAAGAHVPAPGRRRPPQGLQRVWVRQHDGDQHPRPPQRHAAGAHHAGVQGHLPPGPLPPPLHRAHRKPQEGNAAVDPGPGGPRRDDPEPGPEQRHPGPEGGHGDRLLQDALPAADHEAGLPGQVRLLPGARRHRARLRRPPEAPAGLPGRPAPRRARGGPFRRDPRRQGALQGRREEAGHGRAGLHPRLQRAQLAAPGLRRLRLPAHVRPVPGEGREERDVGELRVRAADGAEVRREPGKVLRQGAAQGDERAGHQRHHAHPGRGDQGGDRYAVHQGGVPQEVQAVAGRRHPLRDLRQLPDLPALPRRPRSLGRAKCAPSSLPRTFAWHFWCICVHICFFRAVALTIVREAKEARTDCYHHCSVCLDYYVLINESIVLF